jgi:hypothetical protein
MSDQNGSAPPERPSFMRELEDELIAGLDALGPRDRKLLSVLIEKVRKVEAEHGEKAACELIDAVIEILRHRPDPQI